MVEETKPTPREVPPPEADTVFTDGAGGAPLDITAPAPPRQEISLRPVIAPAAVAAVWPQQTCPSCAKTIGADLRACPLCGVRFDRLAPPRPPETQREDAVTGYVPPALATELATKAEESREAHDREAARRAWNRRRLTAFTIAAFTLPAAVVWAVASLRLAPFALAGEAAAAWSFIGWLFRRGSGGAPAGALGAAPIGVARIGACRVLIFATSPDPYMAGMAFALFAGAALITICTGAALGIHVELAAEDYGHVGKARRSPPPPA